jgi:hypothetical protein
MTNMTIRAAWKKAEFEYENRNMTMCMNDRFERGAIFPKFGCETI